MPILKIAASQQYKGYSDFILLTVKEDKRFYHKLERKANHLLFLKQDMPLYCQAPFHGILSAFFFFSNLVLELNYNLAIIICII